MCKLILGLQINNDADTNDMLADILLAQERDLLREQDGISALVVNKNNGIKVMRDLKNYDDIIIQACQMVKDAKVIGLHTRTKSSGKTDLPNVHFFKKGNRFFAHNGFVSEYTGTTYGKNWGKDWDKKKEKNKKVTPLLASKRVLELEKEIDECFLCKGLQSPCSKHTSTAIDIKTINNYLASNPQAMIELPTTPETNEDMSDSWNFLHNLPEELDRNVLVREMNSKGFSGIATLFEADKKRIFLMATRSIKVHTDFKNYMVMYSYMPESKIQTVYNWLGLPIITDKTGSKLEEFEIGAGVYEIPYDPLVQTE